MADSPVSLPMTPAAPATARPRRCPGQWPVRRQQGRPGASMAPTCSTIRPMPRENQRENRSRAPKMRWWVGTGWSGRTGWVMSWWALAGNVVVFLTRTSTSYRDARPLPQNALALSLARFLREPAPAFSDPVVQLAAFLAERSACSRMPCSTVTSTVSILAAYSRTSWVIFIEQNFGPHIEQKCATLADSGQRLVVVGAGSVRVEAEVELVFPAELEARLGQGVVADLCAGWPLAGRQHARRSCR